MDKKLNYVELGTLGENLNGMGIGGMMIRNGIKFLKIKLEESDMLKKMMVLFSLTMIH